MLKQDFINLQNYLRNKQNKYTPYVVKTARINDFPYDLEVRGLSSFGFWVVSTWMIKKKFTPKTQNYLCRWLIDNGARSDYEVLKMEINKIYKQNKYTPFF